MGKKQIVLLKLTGEFLKNTQQDAAIDAGYVKEIARQIRALQTTHYFGIVVGGGNFFRGTQEGPKLGMSANTSDSVGMMATLMNALIVQEIFASEGLDAALFSAFECPSVAEQMSPQNLRRALQTKDCVIFGGGLGVPFFTTDTTAVVRGCQMEATEVWKITKVDGIYTEDPHRNPQAERIPELTYDDALHRKLAIMDETAFTLARDHRIIIRIFSLFTPQALMRAAHEPSFGSRIVPSHDQLSYDQGQKL